MEPCVFIHYSDSNIRQKSISECLKSPLFQEYYKGQPFNDNMLRPCPMLENPMALRNMVKKTGAKSTNLIQAESADELCSKCDEYARLWAPKAKEIWEEQERFKPFTQYYRDTPEGKAQLGKNPNKIIKQNARFSSNAALRFIFYITFSYIIFS